MLLLQSLPAADSQSFQHWLSTRPASVLGTAVHHMAHGEDGSLDGDPLADSDGDSDMLRAALNVEAREAAAAAAKGASKGSGDQVFRPFRTASATRADPYGGRSAAAGAAVAVADEEPLNAAATGAIEVHADPPAV